jgi:hypothetical protein
MLVSPAVGTSAQRYARAALLACLMGLPACSVISSSTKPSEPVEVPADPVPPDSGLDAATSDTSPTGTAPTGNTEAARVPPLPAFKPVARVQRIAPFRHVSEFMTAADWQSLKADTVGLKICAPAELAEKTVELADPSPLSMLNEAAIAWGKASRWEVVNAEGATFPICTFVIARFGR